MLQPTELANRIRGARETLGLTQRQLEQRFEKANYDKTIPSRLEREDIAPTGLHIRMLADVLAFPEAWFSETNLTDFFGGLSESARDVEIEQLRRMVAALATLATTPSLGAAARQLLEDELAAARQWSPNAPPSEEPRTGEAND